MLVIHLLSFKGDMLGVRGRHGGPSASTAWADFGSTSSPAARKEGRKEGVMRNKSQYFVVVNTPHSFKKPFGLLFIASKYQQGLGNRGDLQSGSKYCLRFQPEKPAGSCRSEENKATMKKKMSDATRCHRVPYTSVGTRCCNLPP